MSPNISTNSLQQAKATIEIILVQATENPEAVRDFCQDEIVPSYDALQAENHAPKNTAEIGALLNRIHSGEIGNERQQGER